MAAAAIAWCPLFLDLRGVPVLVVGGGAVAARKIRSLRRAGARITVVARTVLPVLARDKSIRVLRQAYTRANLRGARLVFAATDDPALNARIAQHALQKGIWCNVAAPRGVGDVLVPASLQRGRLCIAISTGGTSASAARNLRREISQGLGHSWGAYLKLLEARRKKIMARVKDAKSRRRLLQALGSARWVEAIRKHGHASVARKMDMLIRKFAKKS